MGKILNLSYSQTDIEDGLSKLEFKRLRPLAMKVSYFLFNELLYKKHVAVMCSPLKSTLADGVLCL